MVLELGLQKGPLFLLVLDSRCCENIKCLINPIMGVFSHKTLSRRLVSSDIIALLA